MFERKNKGFTRTRGFTIIELVVSLGIYVGILLVSVSALLNAASVYRKAEASRTALDNINFAMENMARHLRVAINYHCGDVGDRTAPRNCGDISDPAALCPDCNFIAYKSSIGQTDGLTVAFRHNAAGARIERSTACTSGGCTNWVPVTAPELSISNAQFIVAGAPAGDLAQPKTLILIGGTAGAKPEEAVRFDLQTLVTQRIFDT